MMIARRTLFRKSKIVYEIFENFHGNILMMPRISVIIPTYNRPELLLSAIGSVLNQTFQDFELIVVDDASEGQTQDVLTGFNDRRIKYIRHNANRGEAASRNTGITHAKGEFIGFLDDDDQWLPEKLRLQVDLLEKSSPKTGGVYSGFYAIDMENGITLGQWVPKKRGNIYADMKFDNFVGTPSTVLLRRECFYRAGLFDEGIAYGLDYDLWIRISKEFHFDYIKTPLVKYYFHKNQISNNLEIRSRGREALLRKHIHFFTSNKKAHTNHLLELGLLYRNQQEIGRAKTAFLEAIRIYPIRVSGYAYLIKCLGFYLLGKGYYTKLKERKDSLISYIDSRKSEYHSLMGHFEKVKANSGKNIIQKQ
jgi:glycosyltransferase involved in cell wall biosynthesis